MSRVDLVAGTFGINEWSVLSKFLPKMKNGILVISADKMNGLYQTSLKDLCGKYPTNILDMTNTSNPKCVVTSSQLPKPDTF